MCVFIYHEHIHEYQPCSRADHSVIAVFAHGRLSEGFQLQLTELQEMGAHGSARRSSELPQSITHRTALESLLTLILAALGSHYVDLMWLECIWSHKMTVRDEFR